MAAAVMTASAITVTVRDRRGWEAGPMSVPSSRVDGVRGLPGLPAGPDGESGAWPGGRGCGRRSAGGEHPAAADPLHAFAVAPAGLGLGAVGGTDLHQHADGHP